MSRKSSKPDNTEEVIADIRITDRVLKRMIAREQRKLGDPNITKTAGRIIERYFAMQSPEPSGSLATHST